MRVRALVGITGISLAFGGVTGTYAALSSAISGRGVFMQISSSLNADVVISLDGGTTDWMVLPAGQSVSIPFGSLEVEFSGTVSVKHNGAAATSGIISVGIIRAS